MGRIFVFEILVSVCAAFLFYFIGYAPMFYLSLIMCFGIVPGRAIRRHLASRNSDSGGVVNNG